jgi:hypothetical protein
MSTLKQRQKAVDRAVEAMRKAADELSELQSICIEYGVDTVQEERFSSDLRERASYWENCTWWKK